jgi:hypothetical protein
VNSCDVALASLEDPTLPVRNEVPDPSDRSHFSPIVDVVPAQDVWTYMDREVFIAGRTTPFEVGRLMATKVREFPIRLPDWRNYMFADLCVIERTGQGSFSAPGDSGAVIYVLDGTDCRALAFVVGGNSTYTFATPAAVCLKAMNARLYAPKFQ